MLTIILSKQRSGSTLLIDFLNSHPDIEAFGEQIEHSKDDKERLGIIQGLEERPGNNVFKIMYNQLTVAVEDYLLQREIPIIHLKRENHTARLVSDWINRHKDVVGRESAESYEKLPPVKITVDPAWFKYQYSEDLMDMAHLTQMFKKNPYMEITYEEMTGNGNVSALGDNVSKRLTDFLGVKECSLTTKLVKQNPKDPKDSVLNYEELL
jgi:hypothetical protein